MPSVQYGGQAVIEGVMMRGPDSRTIALSRILLLPVVAGILYEVLKLSGKYADAPLYRFFIMPGLWLQKLTTNQPDDGQVEVAIAAIGAVLKDGGK